MMYMITHLAETDTRSCIERNKLERIGGHDFQSLRIDPTLGIEFERVFSPEILAALHEHIGIGHVDILRHVYWLRSRRAGQNRSARGGPNVVSHWWKQT
jgi:hypothetical protein